MCLFMVFFESFIYLFIYGWHAWSRKTLDKSKDHRGLNTCLLNNFGNFISKFKIFLNITKDSSFFFFFFILWDFPICNNNLLLVLNFEPFKKHLIINTVINKCNDYWSFYKSSKELTHMVGSISKNWQDPYGLFFLFKFNF
jgi:hypothetical protein